MGHKWSYVIIIHTFVNCGWHDSAHIRDTPPVGFFNPIRHARALKGIFSSLAFRKAMKRFIVIRVVYTRIGPLYIRVVPAAIITEHHSLCIRNGDLACCNCLRKIRKLYPEIAFVDTSSGSSLTQAVVGPSSPSCQHGAGPSSPSSQHGAGPI